MIVRQPNGRSRSWGAHNGFNAVFIKKVDDAYEERNVDLILSGFHEMPREFTHTNKVDTGFFHIENIVFDVGFRP